MTPHRLHIWGKTPSWSSLPGAARDILRVLWRWSRRGRGRAAGGERPGKAFYGQDHEGFPCRPGPRAAPLTLFPASELEGRARKEGLSRERGKRLGGGPGGSRPEVRGAHQPPSLPSLSGPFSSSGRQELTFTEDRLHARHSANALLLYSQHHRDSTITAPFYK